MPLPPATERPDDVDPEVPNEVPEPDPVTPEDIPGPGDTVS